MHKLQTQHKILILTIVAVVIVWTADAFMDSFVFHEGPFLQLMTVGSPVSVREPYLRVFLTISFILFALVLLRIARKKNSIERVLSKHSAAIETSMDGISIYNSNDEYIYVNQAYAEVNGYESPKDIIGKTCLIVYGEKEYERMKQTVMPVLQKSGKWRGELAARRKNGSAYFQEASITMLEDGGRVCIVRDISWRKRSEERLHRSERFLNTIFNSIRDPFCIFDSDFRIIRVNEAYAQMKNRREAELIGRKCHEALFGRDTLCDGCVVSKTFSSADPCAKDKFVTLHDGTEAWVEIYTYPIVDDEGKATHVMEYTRDITERKKAEEEKRRLIDRLGYLSRTDGLTGLINRRALTDSLAYEIDRSKRYASDLSLILCDIDNFKEINDTHGHDAGDRALQLLSGTLKTILRKADIAGRYGGDEFMLILPETSDKGAEGLAEKLLTAVRDTELRSSDGSPVKITMSVGIACLDLGRDTIDTFIKRADDAMYISKAEGRDRVSTMRP